MPVVHRAAHKLIVETAKGMAHELYDTMMSDNIWYAAWKARFPGLGPKALEAKFVVLNTAKLLPQARATLVHMLTLTSTDEATKAIISDALIDDVGLRQGRLQAMKPSTEVLRRVN